MAETHGQNKQANLEFKTCARHRMDALGQYALNQATRRFYHFTM
jgi:hypothetical protein